MQSPYAHEMKINILRSQIKTHKKFLAVTKFLCWLQLGLSAWMAAFAIIYLSTNNRKGIRPSQMVSGLRCLLKKGKHVIPYALRDTRC